MRPVPLALAFLLLALLAPAQSHAVSPAGWEYGRAGAVALKVWQGQVPCDRLSIVLDPPGHRTPDGLSTASLYGYVLVHPDTGARVEPCTVHLTVAVQAAGWLEVCTVLLHEVGHLAGREHTPHGLMAAEYERPDPRCNRRGRPTLGLPEPKSPADQFKYAMVSDI